MRRAAINQLSSDIALPNRSRIVQCRRTSQNIAALVPRGGLHQPQDINDLGKGGSTDRSTRSLRFPGKVSHQRADFPVCVQIRRGPLAGQWSRRAAPGVLAISKIMLSSSGVVASDPPRPYKPAARFGTISRTLRIVAEQFRISLHSDRDPRDVRATSVAQAAGPGVSGSSQAVMGALPNPRRPTSGRTFMEKSRGLLPSKS